MSLVKGVTICQREKCLSARVNIVFVFGSLVLFHGKFRRHSERHNKSWETKYWGLDFFITRNNDLINFSDILTKVKFCVWKLI